MYSYIYQATDKNYVILHALDGYDEISLTGDFKMIDRKSEKVLAPDQIGFHTIKQEDIHGGESVTDAAKIFVDILSGKATSAQNNVVVANSGMAIYCANKNTSIEDAMQTAQDSLSSGKALEALKKLIE